MHPTLRGFLLGLVSVLMVGCGSGSPSNGRFPDAADTDVTAPEVGTADGATADGGMDVPQPPPMSGEGNVLLFRGPADIIRHGAACSGEAGGTTDRWCAFTSPSTSNVAAIDLFVINVTRAAAGIAIACGGAVVDANCLKLTGGFYEESQTPFPHGAAFQGDTLVYFDNTLTAYGWRPGMTNGRVLVNDATGAVHDCFASAKGTGVLCFRDLNPQPVAGLVKSDLLVGRLDTVTDPPLTKVDTVVSNDSTETSTQQRLRYGFSPDGVYVVWSSEASQGGVETLKKQKVGDDGTRTTVASDVSRWWISPDGAYFYWLSQFNYDASGMRSGTLQTAPFSGDTAPTTLLANVGDFTLSGSGAIVARTMVTGFRGDLKSIPDPIGAPTAITTLDTGVQAFLSVSPKGHVAYTKVSDSVFAMVVDLYVKKLDGTGSLCPLTGQANGLTSMFFLPGGGGVVWAKITNLETATDAFNFRESFTSLSDCKTVTVADNIANFGIAGDNGVLVEDEYDGMDGTLRIQSVTGGDTLSAGQPVLIQTRMNDFITVTPTPGVVLFTVAAGSPDDGLYLRLIDTTAAPGDVDAAVSLDGDQEAAPAAGIDAGDGDSG